jgi:WD40 repeat protein
MLRRYTLPSFVLLTMAVCAVAESGQAPVLNGDAEALPAGAVMRLGGLRWRHDDFVRFAAFLPNGKEVVSVGEDLTLRITDFPSGKELRRIDMTVNQKALPGFKRAAGTLPIKLAISKDGKTVAAQYGFISSVIQVFDLATGKALKELNGESLKALAFSPDGQHLASLHTAADGGCTIRVWDWKSAKEINQLQLDVTVLGLTGLAAPFGYTPEGKSFVIGAVKGLENTGPVVAFVDIATGVKTLTAAPGKLYPNSGIPALSPDGKTVATCEENRTIKLLDIATQKEVWQSKLTQIVVAQTVIFNPDGTRLYGRSAFGTILEIDAGTGKLLRELDEQPTDKSKATLTFNAGKNAAHTFLSISPNGKTLLLTGIDNAVHLIDVAAGKEIVSNAGSPEPLVSVAYSADGKHVLTRSGSSLLCKWDATKGSEMEKIQLAAVVPAITPDGRLVARWNAPKKDQVEISETGSGLVVGTISVKPTDRSSIEAVLAQPKLFLANSKLLAVRWPAEQKIELFEVSSGKLLRTLKLPGAKDFPNKTSIFMGRDVMYFSPDGVLVAAPASANTMAFWNIATGERVGDLLMPNANWIQSAAFSADGRCFALDLHDGTVALYELATLKPRRTMGKALAADDDAPTHVSPLDVRRASSAQAGSRVVISPDTNVLAHAGTDKIVHVWDIASGAAIAAFKGHNAEINALAFAPGGKALASASDDGTALIWDLSKLVRPAAAAKAMTLDELEGCWQALAADDTDKAFTSMCRLIAAPADSIPYIKEHLKPREAVDLKRIRELVGQLGDDQFKVRDKANSELAKIGDQIVPVIDQALQADVPLEIKHRLEILRGKFTGLLLQGERLRAVRAVEVLERIGSIEARQVLTTLAQGAPSELLTRSAQAALKR